MRFETYLRESVQGLEVGAAVRYRGVSIGRVEELGLVSAEYRRAEGDTFGPAFQLVFVRFAVDTRRVGEAPSVDDAIRLGLRARIAAQGITGVYYLELDFVDPERFPVLGVPWEPRYTYIPAIPSTVAQVQNAAEALLQRLQDVDIGGLLGNLVRPARRPPAGNAGRRRRGGEACARRRRCSAPSEPPPRTPTCPARWASSAAPRRRRAAPRPRRAS